MKTTYLRIAILCMAVVLAVGCGGKGIDHQYLSGTLLEDHFIYGGSTNISSALDGTKWEIISGKASASSNEWQPTQWWWENQPPPLIDGFLTIDAGTIMQARAAFDAKLGLTISLRVALQGYSTSAYSMLLDNQATPIYLCSALVNSTYIRYQLGNAIWLIDTLPNNDFHELRLTILPDATVTWWRDGVAQCTTQDDRFLGWYRLKLTSGAAAWVDDILVTAP